MMVIIRFHVSATAPHNAQYGQALVLYCIACLLLLVLARSCEPCGRNLANETGVRYVGTITASCGR